LNKDIFEECLEAWKASDGTSKFWPVLAEKYGYASGEILRSRFKRERKNRGIFDKNAVVPVRRGEKKGCKVLCFDIETTPLLCFAWGMWQQNINQRAVVEDWHVLSWSAKWLFEDSVMSAVLTPKEARNHDDKRIIEQMWKILDEADVVIAHNAARFDIPRMNTRFLYHGFPPPSYYQVVDTLKVARSNFAFTSNALNYVNGYLRLPQKKETGFQLWVDCFYGDSDALKKMLAYNENDVLVLEELYVLLRPWIKGHPNLGLFVESKSSICPNCGSKKLEWEGYYNTPMGRYRSFRCECGAIGRGRKNIVSKKTKERLVR